MTTAFQAIIDNASNIVISKRKKVSQTISRDGTVRATSIGGQIWEFAVTLPSGPRYSDYRAIIEKAEALDRVTVGTISINNPGHSWINEYQGDLVDPSAVTANFVSGNTITLVTGDSGLSVGQFKFRAGDYIQLETTGAVYTVTADVAHDQSVVTLHRPVRDAAANYALVVGQNVSWNVICVNFPNWGLFDFNQVDWDGPFIFAEVI
jgi:hypothetical protein